MALTAAQIVTLATQAAKTPGMTSQAGQKLNAILSELCQTYDLNSARTSTTFTFNTGPAGTNSGTGPYILPSDYLRTQNGKQFYVYNGQPYFMIRCELWEYDALIQQPGFSDFPRDFTVNTEFSPPQEFVWPPPSIAVPVTVRYFRQMPDIATPETSSVAPWFPYTNYLITRLTGEMMAIADDTRAQEFLTDKEEQNPQGAGVLLRRYLNLKDDPEGRTKTVELDRRRFGGSQWAKLPNTKSIGWVLAFIFVLLSNNVYAHASRPSAWCGWQMRQWFGGGPEFNLAANWARRGHSTYPHVGAVVVWPHHVGYIAGGDSKGWLVRSGNDGNRIRTRVISLSRVIAVREL